MRLLPLLLLLLSLGCWQRCDAQLLSLGCDSLDAAVSQIVEPCCTGTNCEGNAGMPKMCEGDCIGAFQRFYDSCQGLIEAEPNAAAYSRFLEACRGNGDATDFRPELPAPGGPDALEIGTVFADEDDVVVSFQRSYSRPIVFAGIPTENGDEEVSVRIRSISKDAKQLVLYADVPSCANADHAFEQINWMVTEEGSFQTVQVGTVASPADSAQGLEWVQAPFYSPIESPVVVTQVQTHTGGDWTKTRQQAVTNDGFQIKLEEDGADTTHNQEMFGWMAMSAGVGTVGGLRYEAIATPAAVTHEPYDIDFTQKFHSPAIFGCIATYNGGDPAHLRQFSPLGNRGAQVFVEEDTCSDAEQAHAAESLHVLVINPTYPAPPPPPPPPPPPADHVEVGTVWADESEVTIDYVGQYVDPVIVCGIPTEFGDEEVAIRIISTTDSSFNVYADVPNHAGVGAVCGSTEHEPEMFNWLITSSGAFEIMQAGKVQSDADVDRAFDWIDAAFPQPMEAAPAVISQIQTHTGSDWVNTRHQSITAGGFQLKMEEDGQDTAHNQETIGWIALPVGTGTLGGLTYEAILTPAAVTHEPYDIAFSARFRGTPALFGSMATYNGGDPAHLRQFSPVSDRGAQVFVEEDTCMDAEVAHAAESLSLLVIQPTYAAPRGPQPPTDCSALDSASYTQECPEITEWHASIDMSGYVGTPVCNVLVSTGGTTCADYCASQGGACQHAQDNQNGCNLAAAHDRQDTSQNGCLQSWGDQICGCSGTSMPVPPPPPPPPAPLPRHDCAGLDPASYNQECAEVTEWHPSIDMSEYVGTTVCNVLVSTGGTTCADYCASQGETCRHAQDNQNGCNLAAAHDRQDTSQNGCLQSWGDQICGCSSSGDAVPPPPPAPGVGGTPHAMPSSTIVATDGVAGYTTYRLEVTLGVAADNIYTVFGEPEMPMNVPGAYQVATPFGADVAGVNPDLAAVMPTAAFDSWLTVGLTTGGAGEISSIGIAFGAWTEQAGITTDNGALFWMDPSAGPAKDSGAVTLAQLTVRTGSSRLSVQMGAQGHAMFGLSDWTEQVNFEIMGALAGGPGGGH
jgi:hypothetical protein